MRPVRLFLAIVPLALLVGACSSTGSSPGTSPAASVAGATGSSGPSAAAGAPEITTGSNATVGSYLVGPDGKTLYIFKKDTAGSGSSSCSGSCATTWPPFTLTGGVQAMGGSGVSGTIGTITRSDGSTQVTYDGMPLYYYGGDSAAGDVNGQGIGGVWFAATPTGSTGGAAPSAAPSSSGSSYSNY